MDNDTLIDGLPGASQALKALARRGEIKTYAKNRVLIGEGEQADTLFVILSGRLRAYTSGTKDRELTLGRYGPGEYVGEMSLDGGPRSASVLAMERTVCAFVTRRTLEAHLIEYPAFAFELLSKVIWRARAATLTASLAAMNDVYGRLRLVLLALRARPDEPPPHRLRERLTHKQMSEDIGCSREMVSRILKSLERGGYVGTDDDGVLILLRPLPMKW